MNIVMWMLAGGIVGWIGFSYLRFNEERGLMVSAIIGAIGGLVGGKLIEPMFMDAQAVAGAFSTSGLVFAALAAAGLLAVGNLVHNKWGV